MTCLVSPGSRPCPQTPAAVRFALFLALATACDAPTTMPPPADAGTDAPRPPPPSVSTSLGSILGVRGAGYAAYLGIPYARPPLGALRWASPEPHPGWGDAPLVAARAPAACPQTAIGARLGDEDCLYLNVHVPDPAPEDAPVMVWMHGGAFVFGEGLQIDRSTAGDVLAREHGVVVVSMNYRLGVLGFFTHPALPEASGNQGIEDQRLALEWVRDHIADFGGDPGNVTIFGESAGGMSVCLHMISPASRGLFHRVVSQSGLCDTALPTAADQATVAGEFSAALGCSGTGDEAGCLRAAAPEALLDALGSGGDVISVVTGEGMRFAPSADGTVLPASFRETVLAGEIADVPTIIGWNRDEGTLFVALAERQGIVADAARYHDIAMRTATEAGLDVTAVEAAYPLAAYPDAGAAIAAITGDHRLACPSRRAALLLAEAGVPTWVYRFDQTGAGFQIALDRDLGAFHSAEIQFVFGHPVGAPRFGADEETLRAAMSATWTRFARTGDPNGALPAWAPFAPGAEPSMTLTAFPAASSGVHAPACALWD